MSASIRVVEVVQDLPPDRRNGEGALLVRQLSVIREMLGTLDTVTIAGQHHLMDKVIAFVNGQLRRAPTCLSDRNRATLVDLITQLRGESDHLLPDAARFAQRAENLINLLTAIG